MGGVARGGGITNHDVDAEHMQHAGHDGPLEERVERRALERVAGVQEQRAVGGGVDGAGPLLVHGGFDARETAVTRARLGRGVDARSARAVGLVEVRVHVVGVQHEQPERMAAADSGQRHRAQRQAQRTQQAHRRVEQSV